MLLLPVMLLTSVYLEWFLCSYKWRKKVTFFFIIDFHMRIFFFKEYLFVSPLVHRSEELLIVSLDYLLDCSDFCPQSHPDRKNKVSFGVVLVTFFVQLRKKYQSDLRFISIFLFFKHCTYKSYLPVSRKPPLLLCTER